MRRHFQYHTDRTVPQTNTIALSAVYTNGSCKERKKELPISYFRSTFLIYLKSAVQPATGQPTTEMCDSGTAGFRIRRKVLPLSEERVYERILHLEVFI